MEITSGQPAIQLGGGYGNDGFGNGGWGIMFLAFLAMMGGGGLWGNNRGGVPNNVATTDTVNQAMQYSNLQQQNGEIMAEIQRQGNAALTFGADKYMELQRDIASNGSRIDAVLSQLQQCCCTIQRQIDATVLDQTKQNYELRISMDKQFCALNERMTAQENQRLRDQVENLRDDMRTVKTIFALGSNRDGCNGFGNSNWLSGFGFPA